MQQHNLKQLLDLGLRATVNSDDPSYFGGYMNANFLEAQRALGLGRDDIYRLVRNSFEAAFAPEERKAALIQELDAYLEGSA
jgi:adenosine deaminase